MNRLFRCLLLFILFKFLLVGCFAARGQSLTPKLFVSGSDTSFCFSGKQARLLAKLLTSKQYQAKELVTTQKVIEQQAGQIETKGQIIQLQQEEITIRNSQLEGKEAVIVAQNAALDQQQGMIDQLEKQVKKERRKRKFITIVQGAAVVLTIILLI